jgi:hypothetical protein
MAEKYFTLREAQDLLPFIAPQLEQAREQKRRMDKLDEELSRASAQIMVLGGSIPPRNRLAQTRLDRDQFAEHLKESVSKIVETGCLIKDLEVGLVDFPALMRGEEIYLCWKLGEHRIEYWHGIDEGFAGRKLIENAGPGDEPPGGPHIH